MTVWVGPLPTSMITQRRVAAAWIRATSVWATALLLSSVGCFIACRLPAYRDQTRAKMRQGRRPAAPDQLGHRDRLCTVPLAGIDGGLLRLPRRFGETGR